MSITTRISDIVSRVGTQTYDLADQINDVTRRFTCSLWARFPQQMVGRLGLNGYFARAFLNQACRDLQLPDPPVSQFQGGQCCNLNYNVTVQAVLKRCYRHEPFGGFTITRQVLGRIDQARFITPPPGGNSWAISVPFERCNGTTGLTNYGATGNPIHFDGCYTEDPNSPRRFHYDGTVSSVRITNITTVNNVPDNCGNIPPEYAPHPEPTSEDITNNYTINNYDGTNLEIPITLNVFDNDISASFEFPLSFDVGGVTVDVDLGGITINNSNDFGGFPGSDGSEEDVDRLPTGERHPLPEPSPEPEPEPEAPEEIPPTDPRVETVVRDESSSGTFPIKDNLMYLTIQINKLPTNTSSRWGENAADVQYCGWIEWISNGFLHPRTLIQFEKNIFYPPKGVTGYGYTLYRGCLGVAIEYYLVEE